MASYNGATSLGLNDQSGRAAAAPYYTAWAGTPAPSVFGVAAPVYRMRAYDTTLATTVYWSSGTPSAYGYDGPGPLTNVVVTYVSLDQ